MTNEEWRSVAGWEGLYEVSSLGRVRSLARHGRPTVILKPLIFGPLPQWIHDIGHKEAT